MASTGERFIRAVDLEVGVEKREISSEEKRIYSEVLRDLVRTNEIHRLFSGAVEPEELGREVGQRILERFFELENP